MTNLTKFGLVGSTVVALCCFTPILVILLGLLGLGWLIGYLDYVLFPLLIIFIAVTIFAFARSRRHA